MGDYPIEYEEVAVKFAQALDHATAQTKCVANQEFVDRIGEIENEFLNQTKGDAWAQLQIKRSGVDRLAVICMNSNWHVPQTLEFLDERLELGFDDILRYATFVVIAARWLIRIGHKSRAETLIAEARRELEETRDACDSLLLTIESLS